MIIVRTLPGGEKCPTKMYTKINLRRNMIIVHTLQGVKNLSNKKGSKMKMRHQLEVGGDKVIGCDVGRRSVILLSFCLFNWKLLLLVTKLLVATLDLEKCDKPPSSELKGPPTSTTTPLTKCLLLHSSKKRPFYCTLPKCVLSAVLQAVFRCDECILWRVCVPSKLLAASLWAIR